jgi:hypothetical protein
MSYRDEIEEEQLDWYCLSPVQRWEISEQLWQNYLELGGSLDPESDTQSPFFDPETPSPVPFDGRPGMRIIRRSGI